jgi:1-aminocyclopropane-1-carboxylate deaminase/D-cysteine desulfhydrase-like pyridoxal-dependent ACC family enzyme
VDTVDLGVWRTPLEPAPRLSERIGLRPDDLWIKRDDWIGHGGGGNKLRKLEYLCARAIGEGATTLITSGAAQSNYCRLTAASARRLGLEVVLVLAGDGIDAGTGNLTLDGVFGADIRWAGDVQPSELTKAVQHTADVLAARGERPAILPFGGSDACGALGYLACAREIEAQEPEARHVITGVGSGGTMAGLVAGLGADRIRGIDAGAAPDAEQRVARMVKDLTGEEPRLHFDTTQIGPGYEEMTPQARQAIVDAGGCEGLILDPVYGAKAFAGLVAAVQRGEIQKGERTVYLHTGGLPGFFGHPLAAEFAARE